MTTATTKNINPYYTLVECLNCHHQYKPRSREPLVCPRCFRPFNAKVVEVNLKEMSILDRLEILKHLVNN